MCRLLPATALLLLASAGTRAAGPSTEPRKAPKAVVSLDPVWDRLLEKDSVTLQCRGAYPQEDNSTQWFHNGKRLPGHSSSYAIADARVNNSGEYSCQTDVFKRSDPVQLKVYAGWLLLQAPRWELRVGEPLRLRCHSWKNVTVRKVQYFQNRRGQKFSYRNTEFSIPHARRSHSGSYFCRGMIGTLNVSSEAVHVSVEGVEVPGVSAWLQIAFYLAMGLLFAADTGLYVSAQRELRRSRRMGRSGQVRWSKGP